MNKMAGHGGHIKPLELPLEREGKEVFHARPDVRRIARPGEPVSRRELAEYVMKKLTSEDDVTPAPQAPKIRFDGQKLIHIVDCPPLPSEYKSGGIKFPERLMPNELSFHVNKQTHRIHYENETENEVTIVIEPKDG
jgi:hypothetical protein